MKKLFFLIFIILLLQAGFVYALEVNYPAIPGAAQPTDFPSFAKYIIYFGMWTGGIIALFLFVIGGVRYVLSTGNPERMINAKNQIIGSLLGLLVILSSFTILSIINPDLAILDLKPLVPVTLWDPPEVSPMDPISIKSSIDPESSPGRVIEKIFEVYISEYPEPAEEDKWIPRIIRLKNRALAADEITEKVYTINDRLYYLSTQCGCENTHIEPGKECYPGNCWRLAPYECTCDPCEERDEIIQKEEENHNIVYIGEGITVSNQMNRNWELETHDTTFVKEILKQEEEIRLLEDQLKRLKRSEKYITDCPLRSLNSYIQFLSKKGVIESEEGGAVRIVDFYNDVQMIYLKPEEIDPRYNPIPYNKDEMEDARDYITFYCDISGTLEEPHVFLPEEELLNIEEDEDSAGEIMDYVLSESMSCSKEIVFGDLSDRAKRITQLLIDKFKEIVKKEKEIMDSIDKMQEAISRCSSRRTPTDCIHWCTEPLDFLGIPIGCFQGCDQGDPCPDEVKTEFDKITAARDKIDLLVNGKEPEITVIHHTEGHEGTIWFFEWNEIITEEVDYTLPENVGIINLLEDHIPTILEELENIIRIPMKECSIESFTQKGNALFNCSQSIGSTNEFGEVAQFCCKTEDKEARTAFGDCYEECYLEEDYKEHKKCVNECLIRKGEELNDDELPFCAHELNFYCCSGGGDYK